MRIRHLQLASMTTRNERVMIMYNAAINAQNVQLLRNGSLKGVTFPFQEDLKDSLANKVDSKGPPRRKHSLNMYKRVEAVSTQVYRQGQQCGPKQIAKGYCNIIRSCRPIRTKSNVPSGFIIPFLAVNVFKVTQQSIKATNRRQQMRLGSNQHKRAKTADKIRRRPSEDPSDLAKGTDQFLIRKRESLIQNQNGKGSLSKSSKNIQRVSAIPGRDKSGFASYMKETCVKLGFAPEIKLFVIQSGDQVVRKALEGMQGWGENPDPKSCYFHFKWSLNSGSHFREGSNGQYTNYFRSVTSLTNIFQRHQLMQHHLTLSEHYPPSFNLVNQQKEFLDSFQLTSVMNLLKTHVEYIDSKSTRVPGNHRYSDTSLLLDRLLGSQSFYSVPRVQGYCVSIPVCVQICMYMENLKQEYERTKKRKYTLTNATIERLLAFEKLTAPYQKYASCQQFSEQAIVFDQGFGRFKCDNSFFTPSTDLVCLLRMYYDYFKKKQFWSTTNYWLLRAADQEPIITKSLPAILSKRYQYIAQRFILPNKMLSGVKDFDNKPFVIKYWILLRGCQSRLYVYLYNDFYVKTGLQPHGDIHNGPQKEAFMSSQAFEHTMKGKFKVSCKLVIETNIEHIIGSLVDSSPIKGQNNRIQMLQLGFILAQRYHPYLISVNRIDQFRKEPAWLQQMGVEATRQTLGVLFDGDKSSNTLWKLIYQNKVETTT